MYGQQGSHLAYFVPTITTGQNAAEVLKEIDLDQTAAVQGEYLCTKACRVKILQFTLTSEAVVATSTAPTVVFKKHPTPLSSSGSTTLGTLTIPDTTAIGKTIYKVITPNSFAVGDSLEISWTAAVGGSIAGQGLASFICEEEPETEANNSDMVASA